MCVCVCIYIPIDQCSIIHHSVARQWLLYALNGLQQSYNNLLRLPSNQMERNVQRNRDKWMEGIDMQD
jgi:hypothetical protein